MADADQDAPVLSSTRPDGSKKASRPDTEARRIDVGNVTISFDVADIDGAQPYFCLGVRKSGSTVLHKIMNFLAAKNGYNTVDLPGRFFREGLTFAQFNEIDFEFAVRPGNVYSGFRAYPSRLAELGSFKGALKLFMFRDPRDALVSQYFSDAYSHTLPKAQSAEEAQGRDLFLKKREDALASDIDEWVLKRAGSLKKTLAEYAPLLEDPMTFVIRYEDFVFQKERFIKKMLRHFHWSLTPGEMNKLLSLVDIVPTSEDKTRFVRKAIPGDFRAKLKPETINKLNARLSDVLLAYDY